MVFVCYTSVFSRTYTFSYTWSFEGKEITSTLLPKHLDRNNGLAAAPAGNDDIDDFSTNMNEIRDSKVD